MIETVLQAYLAANVALCGGRVWPMKLPQKPTLPAITYRKISGPRIQTHDGASGLAHPRIQISCWAETYLAAKQLAEEVRQDLDGFSGAMGATHVGSMFLSNETDLYDPETGRWHIPVDFILFHDET